MSFIHTNAARHLGIGMVSICQLTSRASVQLRTTKKKTSLCSDLHIINSKFSYNSATAVFLQLESSSVNECTNHITISSCNITYNSGAIGSALYISQNKNTSPYDFEVIVKGSRIEGNCDY